MNLGLSITGREATAAAWSCSGLSGTVETDGHMLAALVRRVTFNQLAPPTPFARGAGGGDWKHSPKRRYSRLLMFLSLALDLLVDCRDSAPGQFHSGFLSYEIRFRVVEPDEEFTRALDYKSARSRVLSLFFSFFSLSLSLSRFFFFY